MQIGDSHFHLNIKAENPVQDMLNLIKENKLAKIVLILNTMDEAQVFMRDFSLLEEYMEKIHVAVLLDINEKRNFNETASFLKEKGICYSVKLHSRISNITIADFSAIADAIADVDYKNIIVDAFFYGSNLENLIGVELAIYLAKRFTEKRVVIAHFGGVKILETMLCTRNVPNLYYDVSCTINYFMGTSVWMDIYHCIKVNSGRVMWGSDYPDFYPDASIQSVQKLFNEYGDRNSELFEKLMFGNLKKIYFE